MHVLVRHDVSGPADKHLSVVLSQYRKSRDLGYTLSCYGTAKFRIARPEGDEAHLPHARQIPGRWEIGKTAGGAVGREGGRFEINPQWTVVVPTGGAGVQLRIAAAKTLAVNLVLVRVESNGGGERIRGIREAPTVCTGDYRHGFAATDVVVVPAGEYVLVASAFEPGQAGSFVLGLRSSAPVSMSAIP